MDWRRSRINGNCRSRQRRAAASAHRNISVSAVVASLAAGGSGSAPGRRTAAVPRDDTLYASGKQWGPYTNFNPLKPDYNTGTVGLVYETLFRYDPLKDKFIPGSLAAASGSGENYVVTCATASSGTTARR